MIDDLKPHIFIEYYFRDNGQLLSEQTLDVCRKRKLFESYGIFNGCEKIADTILSCVKQSKSTVEVKNCHFIKKIKLFLSGNILSAGYDSANSKVDENGKFDPLIIYINPDNVNNEQLKQLLMHELTHAYQDYNLRGKGLSLAGEHSKYGYRKFAPSVAEEYPVLKKKISWLLYYFDNFERSGYIAQIYGELKNCDTVFHTINDIVSYIEKTDVYDNYMYMFELSDQLEKTTDAKTQNMILSILSELKPQLSNDYKTFIKWITLKRKRYQNKFNSVIPKIAYEVLKPSAFSNPPITYRLRDKNED